MEFALTGTALAVGAIFVVAGGVKGVVGMGLPTVAMGALALLMTPAEAASLLIVPSLVTNLWQLFAGPALGMLLRRLAPMMLAIAIGTAAGIGLLTSSASRWPALALGAVLVLYALIGLFLPRLSVPEPIQPWAAPLVGLVTGVLTGATGIFVVPAVPYLGAIGLQREQLIQALGLSFTVSTIALAASLAATGHYSTGVAAASALAVLPALAGMFLGQRLRQRLDAERFRRGFFCALLGVGVVMIVRA